jgi:uncharacterized protein YwqG
MPRNTSLDRDELEAEARTALLVRRSDLPVPLAHPARSFFGGLPKLPRKNEWPRGNILAADSHERETVALTFIAQIDLSELPDFDARPYLPHVGTLYFFCSSSFVDEGSPPGRVIYHSGRADRFPERAPPADLMPLGGVRDKQVKWLDPAADLHAKVEFKYPISFLPFQDFGFQSDPVGGELLTDSLCEALGPGEPEQRDLLMHRGADGFMTDGDWPFNWLMIVLAVRSVLSHVRHDLEPPPWRGPLNEETQAVLREIEAAAGGWLERGASMPPLDGVDVGVKSAFRAWWSDVVKRYETIEKRVSTYAFQLPRDLGDVINHVIRYMAAHDERALASVPRKYIANLERQNHWTAPSFSTPIHQIAGYGSSWQSAPVKHRDDVLLLQLHGDLAFLGWHQNTGCVLHFWLDPDALSDLDFARMETTLECD